MPLAVRTEVPASLHMCLLRQGAAVSCAAVAVE